MGKHNQPDPAGEATAEAFKGFFRPHERALALVLSEAGIEPLPAVGGEPGGHGFEVHMAPQDENDLATGYGSADVTITGGDPAAAGEEPRRIVLWFVRFDHAGSWQLVTRNGYLDWLLLGDRSPTQDIGPRLHVAIQEIFPETLEHRDWFQRRT